MLMLRPTAPSCRCHCGLMALSLAGPAGITCRPWICEKLPGLSRDMQVQCGTKDSVLTARRGGSEQAPLVEAMGSMQTSLVQPAQGPPVLGHASSVHEFKQAHASLN